MWIGELKYRVGLTTIKILPPAKEQERNVWNDVVLDKQLLLHSANYYESTPMRLHLILETVITVTEVEESKNRVTEGNTGKFEPKYWWKKFQAV